ncbi:MAG: TrbI/VirB10 family protein [Rickettsiales bacterium]|jgi:type IV secretion system protein VirB10|nr:TrbI/VirB10 family protein [Rickettsiales bacterium]
MFGGDSSKEDVSPDATADSMLISMQEEEKKKQEEEERQLQIAQKRRIMEERKGSPMFKMQGGGGGKGTDAELDSIIIADRDNLSTVEETKIEVSTSKNSDLSRTVLQGKIIHAILETAIDTDIKSPVRALVSRNVYSESGKNIVIPKGSKLIGSFQAMKNNNLSRLEIVWNRIIRVDGLSIGLSANTADRLGRGGVDGELDSKYVETMKNVFLSSMISIASAVLVEKVTNSAGTTTSTNALTGTTTTGKASDYAIIDATKAITGEMQTMVDNLKVETPTIRIAQGTRINVVVNQDLVLPIFKKQ